MTQIHSVEIDSKAGSAYVYFEPPMAGASVRQVNIGDSIVFDLGVDGRLIGIEILDSQLAKQFCGSEATKALEASRIPVRQIA